MSLILVVEDADYLQSLIAEILQARDHDVVSVGSGKEALPLCHETTPFDLVITDLVMPEIDGLELIRSLQKSHPNLPILAISGAFNGFLKVATALGAAGALEKPFTPDDLLTMVDRILGKANESNDEDLNALTIICPKCAATISYALRGTIAYTGTCPNCRTMIPELRGAMIISFERSEKEQGE
jgi:CheY-like chemotaxis protein